MKNRFSDYELQKVFKTLQKDSLLTTANLYESRILESRMRHAKHAT